MSVTGIILILFVIIHALGNATIYFDWLNTYAEHLHALPLLIWIFRLFMLAAMTVHVFFGIQLSLENYAAKPQSYAVRKSLRATFASRNMIWTGVLIAVYLVYHVLHFTVPVINPELSASQNIDLLGRPDVSKMVVLNFQNFFISCIYIIAMTSVGLHLYHGIQSLFQTTGLNNEKTMPVIIKMGVLAAIIFTLSYISIPVLILLGIVTA